MKAFAKMDSRRSHGQDRTTPSPSPLSLISIVITSSSVAAVAPASTEYSFAFQCYDEVEGVRSSMALFSRYGCLRYLSTMISGHRWLRVVSVTAKLPVEA